MRGETFPVTTIVSNGVILECPFCGHSFTRTIEELRSQIECPNCGLEESYE